MPDEEGTETFWQCDVPGLPIVVETSKRMDKTLRQEYGDELIAPHKSNRKKPNLESQVPCLGRFEAREFAITMPSTVSP